MRFRLRRSMMTCLSISPSDTVTMISNTPASTTTTILAINIGVAPSLSIVVIVS